MRVRLASLLLLMAYLSIWLKPLFPYIDYELNRDYIIKTLCIERDKEVNTCQGQCHLNKEIEKNSSQDEEKQREIPGRTFENETYYLILSSFTPPQSRTINCKECIYLSNYRFLILKSHFHPPESA